MTSVVLLAHIPLLRIEHDEIPFARGSLWRVPFDVFDELTVGAFTDHRVRYEETAPVFYRVDANIDVAYGQHPENDSVAELKIPNDRWAMLEQLDLEYLYRFHLVYADPAWVALLLGAPGGAFPAPRTSVTFAIAPGGEALAPPAVGGNRVRVQGDADLEFCFFPEGASPPLSEAAIARASAYFASLETLVADPELHGAVFALINATSPTLSSAEQLTLAVMGLEELLLPDVRTKLGATFSGRLATLLAADDAHRADLVQTGRTLYDARSAALHLEEPRSAEAASEAARGAHAQQLLVAAIGELREQRERNESWEDIRKALDRTDASPRPELARVPLSVPDGLRPEERLLHTRQSVVGVVSSEGMEGPAGKLLMWVPLIGLANDDTFAIDEEKSVAFMPMTGPELISLEDRDIRRDFAAQLAVPGAPVIACYFITEPGAELDAVEPGIAVLKRRRDLVTIALRLAGFDAFHDPELLGTAVFQGNVRYRRATVLRQSILQTARNAPEQRIGTGDAERVGHSWRVLSRYDQRARDRNVDDVLRIFRRIFDRRFLPVAARASLMIAALEGMLGRSRRMNEKIQLHHFVSHLLGSGDPAAKWFAADGRAFRNAVAHNSWQPDPASGELAHLVAILRGIVPSFLESWLARSPDSRLRPAEVLVNALTPAIS